MINRKNVITVRMPYPNMSSSLAIKSHMYICWKNVDHDVSIIKCQTLKPYMILNNVINHYVDEEADITRNPFKHATRIDCDKVFKTKRVLYPMQLCTSSRNDVCEDTMLKVEDELHRNNHIVYPSLNEADMLNLNPLLQVIKLSNK